jgi:hypothetical protein
MAAEIYARNPHPMFNQVDVSCVVNEKFPDACETFLLSKDLEKSNIDNWYGRIQVTKSLNYLEQSIYQFYLKAQVMQLNSIKYGFLVFNLRDFMFLKEHKKSVRRS